jgi:hypothetical protein
MNAFRQGRSLGTHLIVGVNSDETITACKGPPVSAWMVLMWAFPLWRTGNYNWAGGVILGHLSVPFRRCLACSNQCVLCSTLRTGGMSGVL